MKPSTELKELMLRWYASFATGDMTLTEQILARQAELVFIGTDPAEWITGYEAILQGFKMQTEALGGFQIEPGDLAAYSEGDLGLVVDRPRITLPGIPTISIRSTLVFHRQNGEWKLVQQHNSVGIPNEELVGRALPV